MSVPSHNPCDAPMVHLPPYAFYLKGSYDSFHSTSCYNRRTDKIIWRGLFAPKNLFTVSINCHLSWTIIFVHVAQIIVAVHIIFLVEGDEADLVIQLFSINRGWLITEYRRYTTQIRQSFKKKKLPPELLYIWLISLLHLVRPSYLQNILTNIGRYYEKKVIIIQKIETIKISSKLEQRK